MTDHRRSDGQFRPDAAITQRFYNPDWLTEKDLLAGFVARQDLFDFLRRELARASFTGSVQHTLLVGPRGSGKTTLLKRLAVAIRRDDDLRDHLIPLSFQEELYHLKTLADFWWAACEALSDELEASRSQSAADAFDAEIERARPRALKADPHDTAGLTLLMEACTQLGRRPVFLVDNLDMVMQRIGTRGRTRKDSLSPAYWAFREALSTAQAPILIGASVRLSDPFVGYEKAFYDFFVTKRLDKLSLAEVETVLRHLAERHGVQKDWERRTASRRGRIQALYELTGGNPRALGLIFDLLRQGVNSRAIDDFERLLDLTTPYYKARMENISDQAQVILDALARLGRSVTAAEIAAQAGLETRVVSAQLDGLIDEGVVEKTPGPDKKTHYAITEQLFRIWIQMRGSRRLRQRVGYLSELLDALFSRDEIHDLLVADAEPGARARPYHDFVVAEWLGDGPVSRCLMARAVDGLFGDAGGSPPAWSVVDLPPDLVERQRRLHTLRQNHHCLGTINPTHLLGALFFQPQEWADSLDRLCDPATAEAERRSLESRLAREREALGRDGLSEPEIDLFYDLRLNGPLPLPNLTVAEVEAAITIHKCPTLRAIAWTLLGAGRIAVGSVEAAREWLNFGRTHHADSGGAAWAAVGGTLRRNGQLEAAAEALDEAEAAFRKAIALDPANAWPWSDLGTLLAGPLKRPDEAEAAFRKAIALDPANALPWYRLGDLLADPLRRPDEAEAAYRKAIELDPAWALPWCRLGDLLADPLRRPDEAEAAYRKAIELDPAWALPWCRLGDLLADPLQRPDEAEAAFRKAIALDPASALPWYRLGDLLADPLRRPDEAEAAYRKAIALDPAWAMLWYCLGDLLLADPLNRYDEAEAAFRKAIALDPAWVWSWYRLGTLLADPLNRYDEAEAAFRKAVELNPANAWPWYRLGTLLADPLNRYDEAEAAFRKAVELDPEEPRFRQNLEWALQRRLLAPAVAAVAAENWGIVRERLAEGLHNPDFGAGLWVCNMMVEALAGTALRLGRGDTLLRMFREIGLERVAAPLVWALQAALEDGPDPLAYIEPEARTATETLLGRMRRAAG